MPRLAWILLAFCLGDTPEQTFAEVKKAALEKNPAALYDLVAPSDRKELEAAWAAERKDLERPEQKEQLQFVAEDLGLKPEEVLKLAPREALLRRWKKAIDEDSIEHLLHFGGYAQGSIVEKRLDGDRCLFKLKIEERHEEVEVVREDGRWWMSRGPGKRMTNELFASTNLMILGAANTDFRENDRDGDGAKNYWVKDIAGLYGLKPGELSIKLITLEIARADRTEGKGRYEGVEGEATANGYLYTSLKGAIVNGKRVSLDDGKGRNAARVAYCAVPAKYGETGRKSYLIDVRPGDSTLYWKDTGGKPLEDYPEDPRNAGWTKIQ